MALTSNVTSNVKLGVCRVKLGGIDLGFTKGGVEVSVETESYAVMVDQLGQTPISEYITGRTCTVKVPMAETTIDHLAAIMPGAIITGTGATAFATVSTGVGTDLLGIAQVLRLHPVGLPDATKTEDFVIPKAATTGQMQFSYKLDDERIFNVEFKAFADSAGKLFYYGPVGINDATGVVT
jgi:hypothetical protein